MKKKFIGLSYLFFFLVLFGGFIALTYATPAAWILRLDQAGILLGYLLTCLSAAIALVAFINRYKIKRWFRQNSFTNRGKAFTTATADIQAMVIPVSRLEQPEWILRWLKPQRVAFLYTEKTLHLVRDLQNRFSGEIDFLLTKEHLAEKRFCLGSAFAPEESHATVREYINHYCAQGIAARNIFVDATGGTVPMSIGAFQAAEELGISSIYIEGTRQGLIKDPRKEIDGNPIFLSDHSKK